MGSQSRSSLSGDGGGLGVPHYNKTQIKSLESAIEKAPNEAGTQIAFQIFASMASGAFPVVATIVTLYQILLLIQKIKHYVDITEEKGVDAAVIEFMKDTVKDQVNSYVSDKITMGLVGKVDSKYRGEVENAVGAVVEQGVEKMEEAFLNEK